MENIINSITQLFQKVEKPDYCIDLIGDCSKCSFAISNSQLDCKGNQRRFALKNEQ